MTTIPAKFRAKCQFCSEPVDTRPGHGAARYVSGWAEVRSAGGWNAIALPSLSNRYAHALCVDLEKSRAKASPWTQLSFDEVEL